MAKTTPEFTSYYLGWHCFTKSLKQERAMWFSHSLGPMDSKMSKFSYLKEGRLVVFLSTLDSLFCNVHFTLKFSKSFRKVPIWSKVTLVLLAISELENKSIWGRESSTSKRLMEYYYPKAAILLKINSDEFSLGILISTEVWGV